MTYHLYMNTTTQTVRVVAGELTVRPGMASRQDMQTDMQVTVSVDLYQAMKHLSLAQVLALAVNQSN